jgi:PPOX class probable F420-dependent enzyme
VTTLSEADARVLLSRARVATLATINELATARLVPFCFVLDGDVVWSVVDDKPKRSRELRRLSDIGRTPAVTILAHNWDEDWGRLWWVRVDGSARVVDEAGELERAIGLLSAKYPQYKQLRPPGPALAIHIERIIGWSGADA